MKTREATKEEELAIVNYYSTINEHDYTEELSSCKKQGLKTEICDCGRALPAFIHFIRCECDDCPFKSKTDKRTLTQILLGE